MSATPNSLAAALRALLAYDAEEADSSADCVRCFIPMNTREGCEPTPECDSCAQELLSKIREVLSRHDAQQPHYVAKVEPINGGMGPNWDEVRLKTGHILQISDEGITVWPNEAAYHSADNANVLAGVSFDFQNDAQQREQHSSDLEWMEANAPESLRAPGLCDFLTKAMAFARSTQQLSGNPACQHGNPQQREQSEDSARLDWLMEAVNWITIPQRKDDEMEIRRYSFMTPCVTPTINIRAAIDAARAAQGEKGGL